MASCERGNKCVVSQKVGVFWRTDWLVDTQARLGIGVFIGCSGECSVMSVSILGYYTTY
jgi:hypothetical protein